MGEIFSSQYIWTPQTTLPMRIKILLLVLLVSVAGNLKLLYNHFGDRFSKFISNKGPEKSHMKSLYNRQEIFAVLPVDTNSIVFLGDSQVQYFSLDEFFKDPNIKNRGIGGDKTSQVINRLTQVTAGAPKKIFLELGVNDFINGISVDSCFTNMRAILTTIRQQSPSTKIYLQSVLPSYPVMGKIKDLNALCEAYCSTNNIVYIDLFDSFYNESVGLKTEYNCGDGLHLNGRGYQKWKDLIAGYVKE